MNLEELSNIFDSALSKGLAKDIKIKKTKDEVVKGGIPSNKPKIKEKNPMNEIGLAIKRR